MIPIKNILFNTWSGAFIQAGGGETQLLQTKLALEKKGYFVLLYDMWKPQFDIDIFHQFSTDMGCETVLLKYKEKGFKTALSTIMWNAPKQDHPDYYRIKEMLMRADLNFTNSIMESVRLSEYFEIDLAKFHKVRNCINDQYFTYGDPSLFREQYGIDYDFVLSVGNIDYRKNTDSIVKVCKKMGLRLVTIGHVKHLPYFNEFKDEYSGYVHLGPIEDVELLKSAYRACTLFVLPSLCETPGIAALEAASQGARIVITQEGSTQEYFGEMATYVNPYDRVLIQQGMEKALNSKPAENLTEYIRSNFSWSMAADEVLEGYKKIICSSL